MFIKHVSRWKSENSDGTLFYLNGTNIIYIQYRKWHVLK